MRRVLRKPHSESAADADAARTMKENEAQGSIPSYGTVDPESTTFWKQYQDKIVWVLGLVFFLVLGGLVFGIGAARGWDAQSGWTHNESVSSQGRFLPEPFVDEPGVKGRTGRDRTGRWYYWKLPPSDVTWYTQMLAWLGYIFHQLTCWTGLYMLQKSKRTMENQDIATELTVPKLYSSQLSFWNWFLFFTNLGFHLLHLIITHTTYDALAEAVTVASSQSSVIMLLIFIIILEYRDRGIFFGWPAQHQTGTWTVRLRFPYAPMYLVRRYHGYAFAWAAIYTFWYHPMENTFGHIMGFAHTYMILHQGALAYTPIHLNKYWRFVLETWVTAHSGVIAAQTGGPALLGTTLWPMFVFGFALALVLTQIFGLPFWRRIHWAFRFIPLAIYIAVVLYCYSWIPDKDGRTWVRIQEIIRIPGIYYLYLLVIWLWLFALIKIDSCCQKNEPRSAPSTGLYVVAILGNLLIYMIFIIVSFVIQFTDLHTIDMITIMIVLVLLFMLGCSVAFILLKQIFGLSGEDEPDKMKIEDVNGSRNSNNTNL